jgi:hypothetical protein
MISVVLNAQKIGNEAVVAVVNMNVLYRGIANPIEIAVPGVTSDKVSVIVKNGIISKTGAGFSVSPGEEPESVIDVLVDNKKVSEKRFRVKNVPEPVAVFAGKHEGQISKEIALKTDMLEVELKDFLWDLKFVIKAFTFYCSRDNIDTEVPSDGNKLTDKMKSLISGTMPGKMIAFKDINAIGPDGKSRYLNQIILTIIP